MSITTIVLIALGVFILWIIFSYNTLVSLKNRGQEAWADIDVQLKRRYDLIPNLVETVKGYATHESKAFEAVSNARASALGAKSIAEKGTTENMLSSALKSVFAIAEAYPELKANQNFLALQNELSDTENKIQAARRFYNGNVMSFNTKTAMFPSNLIASSFNFHQMEFFQLSDHDIAAKEPVMIKF